MSLPWLIGLVVLAILGHGYFWVDGVNRLHALHGPRKLIDGATLGCFLCFLILPVVVVLHWPQLDLRVSQPAEMRPAWLRSYVLFCAGWGILKLVLNALNWYRTDNRRTLRNWQQESVELGLAPATEIHRGDFAQLLAKVPVNEAFQLKIDRKQLAIPRLHAKHVGLKIAHISDLHMTGRFCREWYGAIAAQVNQLEADMICITGDIVEKEACWPWMAESVGRLRAELGVYFVLGNHDFYIDIRRTRQLLEDDGLICLSNRWVETSFNGTPIILAGNERPWNPRATDLAGAPPHSAEQLRIALLHTPDQVNWARDNDMDLALAGHTHGGQIRFPVLGPIVCPSRYGTRYACGVFQRGNTVLHVSRGLAGKTPLRWRCPPEIALLELVCG